MEIKNELVCKLCGYPVHEEGEWLGEDKNGVGHYLYVGGECVGCGAWNSRKEPLIVEE